MENNRAVEFLRREVSYADNHKLSDMFEILVPLKYVRDILLLVEEVEKKVNKNDLWIVW